MQPRFAGFPIEVSTLCSVSHIDRQTHPGLLSDTLMSGATIRFLASTPFAAPVNRRFRIARLFARFPIRFSACLIAAALALVISTSLVYAGQPKTKKHENRHEIEQLEEAWRSAVLKADTTAMSTLLSDDYIAITANGTLQTKAETLANLRSGRVRLTSLDISDRKLRFYGQTALVTSLAEVAGTNAEGDVTGSFRYTRVYVRDPQGKWKIVSFEASRIHHTAEHR
jgi:ketosteroid isomerase-like protein